MRCRGVALLLLGWLSLAATVAGAAERRRVAVLVDDPGLAHAIEVALAPWQLEVVPVREATPAPTVPAAAAAADRLARQYRAGAVLWTSGSGADVGLWVYDVDTQQLIARKIELAPPLDAATAAAVALSAKTLLRASTVAPPPERVGAAAISRPREQLRLEALVGGQAQLGAPRWYELRLGFALSYYPRRLRDHFGLALGVMAGPGVGIDEPALAGRFTDVTLGLAARGAVRFASRWEVEPYLRLSVHFTTLEGAVPELETRVRVDRVNPSLDVGTAIDVSLGQSVRLGVVVGITSLFRYQRYLVNGTPVVELFPVEIDTALRFTAGVW